MIRNKTIIKNKIILGLVIILLCLSLSTLSVFGETNAEAAAYAVLSAASEPTVSSIGGEWAVLGIKQSGIVVPSGYFDGYIERVEEMLKSSGGDLGRKYTEYSRIALTLASLGADVRNVGGYNLLDYINDYDSVTRQGINGAIFALRAKYAAGDTDTDTDTAVQEYIRYILERQNGDGSFGLTEGVPDTDITAMAISALCLYGGTVEIDRAVNRAFLYLSSIQNADGSFSESSDSEASCESTAQVIIAMKRYGLSMSDAYFVKNGCSPLDALDSFKASLGYFHTASSTEYNQMSTEQALLALTEPQSGTRTLVYDTLWFDAGIFLKAAASD